jgi:putative endonuclease
MLVMYYVYAIESLTRKYIYIGITDNINRRLNQHNQGYNRTTKPYRPFRLIYLEELPDRKQARAREKYLKTTTGRKFLREQVDKMQ